jgi:hypothetical protein
MNYDKIKVQQNYLFEKIYCCNKQKNNAEYVGILKDIRSLRMSDVKLAFGEFGERLKNFSHEIDIEHPDLNFIFGGQLSGDKENTFSRDCIDFFKLFYFSIENKISSSLLDTIRNHIFSNQWFSKINRIIDSPEKNQLNVRFVADKKIRKQIRCTKKTQSVQLSDSLLRIKTYWDDCPEDFNQYLVISDDIDKTNQIKDAVKQKKQLLDHGLSNMADEADRHIRQIQENIYFGFSKVTLPFVAIVLAKMCGFDRVTTSHKVSLVFDKENIEFDSIFSSNLYFKDFEFHCNAYNYYEILDIVPSNIINLISYIEKFPEANNRPLFDHYRVLLPSLNLRNQNVEFKDKNFEFCKNIDDFQKKLDFILFKEKHFVGALLGERDGVHFFISYFMEM